MKTVFWGLFLIGAVVGAPRMVGDGPVVELSQGLIQGVSQTTGNGKSFTAFRGIPFAEPPVGDLRFKPPVPAGPWTGIRDGSIEGNSCIQPSLDLPNAAFGDEDCLTLSVYTPQLPASNRQAIPLPVHIFIHGGAYFTGEDIQAHFGPDRFLDSADMVVVVLNYRLGVLGFLSTEDAASPGNYALLDQNLALKWVQNNIAAFGGNPDDVTISGESAGAASVLYHIVSPMSAGLFHRAIAESGTPLNPFALQEHPLHYAQLIAEKAGCPNDTNDALVACLSQVDAYQLADYEYAVMAENFSFSFVPVVENPTSGLFLTEDPRTLLQEGRFNKVAMINGFNRDEGVLVYQEMYPMFKVINDTFFDEVVPFALTVLTDYRTNLKEVSYAIKDVYYNIDLSDPAAVTRASIDMISDMFMKSWVVETINYIAAQGLPVYMYTYNYVGDFYWTNFTGGSDITHTMELIYLYNNTKEQSLSTRDTAFSQNTFVPLWTNFILEGNPTPSGLPAWPATPAGETNYLTIDETLIFSNGYDVDRMNFWLYEVPAIVAG